MIVCSALFMNVLGSVFCWILSVERKVCVVGLGPEKLVHDWMPQGVGSDSLYTSLETFCIGIVSLSYFSEVNHSLSRYL